MNPGRTTAAQVVGLGAPASPWSDRVEAGDWATVHACLDETGCALTGPLLSTAEATKIAGLYDDSARFRATVNMGRHRFGEGEYRHFAKPLQVVINLSDPGIDHTGGEFLLYEQRPRAQSRCTATVIPHGHGLVFTTRDRPVPSRRGWSTAPVRHGVSLIRSGTRFSLGLVFHDAA